MNVGQAVLFEGDTLIVKQFEDDNTVTLRDLNGACITVDKSEITEV